MVEVDPDDPAFKNPTKFVGPVYSKEDAERLAAEKGWAIKPDGDKWRRVVPSPLPKRIFELRPIKWLLEKKTVVICAGGGGIPTMYLPDGTRTLTGVEAVIDKDLASELGIGKTYSIFEILKRTLGLMIIVEGLGAAILFVYWSLIDKVPDGRTLFFAIFHSVAAFCNAGFDLFTGLPGYVPGPPIDHLTVLVLGVIVILGGLGIPVYLDILKRRKIGSRFSTQTRVTVVISLVLVFAGMGALLVTEYWLGGALAGVPWGSRVVVAWFQSVVTRTAGFPGLSTFAPLKPASILVLMALMFIGSGPASMGGGITTGSFTVVLMAVGNFVRGNTRARLARRSVSPETVLRATTIITVATLAIAVPPSSSC